MTLLTVPFDPERTRRAQRPPREGVGAALAALGLLVLGLAIESTSGPAREIGRAIASGAIHGALLVVGWLIVGAGKSGLGAVVVPGAALFLGSVAAAFSTWGALLYLAAPLILFSAGSRHAAMRGIGLTATSVRSLVLGLATGAFLGIHLLISASLTFGYAIRLSSVGAYLAAVAYDIGANALTAEWVFRGAVFSSLWQRWEFWPAAALATAAAVARYLADPALPPAIEVRTGAVFYLALLGFATCALRAGTGSLLPGYLATVSFFAAYRMLGIDP